MGKRFIENVKLFVNDKKFKEILHGSFYSFSAKVIAKLIGIVTSVIAARYYGAEMIGFVALLTSVATIAGLFAGFGMSIALLRLIPEYRVKFSEAISIALYSKILRLVVVISLVVAAIVYILAGTLANSVYNKPDLELFIALMAITLLFQSIHNINVTMLRAIKKIKLFAFTEILPKLISLILLLVLTFLYYDQYNLAYIALVTPIIMSLWLLGYMFTRVLPKTDKASHTVMPSYQNMFILSFPMFLTSSLQMIMAQTDIVMLGVFRATSEIGIYSIVFTLAMLVNFVLNSVNVIAAPKFSELYHEKKMDELAYIVKKSSKLIFWTSLPIIMGLIVLGKVILGIFGAEFIAGYTALVLLAMGQLVNAASGSVGYLLNMVGYQKQFRNIILLAVIANVVLNYMLIPEYGIEGAAWASLVSMTVWNVLSVMFVRKKLGFWTFYFPIGRKKI